MKRTLALPEAWSLQCFGGLRVERGTQVIWRFRTQKTAALLVLLALNGRQNREKICALLWPDTLPESARNSLSAALSSLRRELGDDVLEADRQDISLVSGRIELDMHRFDRALKDHDFSGAVELYAGHLLPGFYDDPFPALAHEYEEKARAAFAARLEELEHVGDFNAVLALARRASALFGDEERWVLALMRAHQGREEWDAALRAYENWKRSARKNGEVASETAKVLAKIIRSVKENRASVVVSTPQPQNPTKASGTKAIGISTQWTQFFGREAERDLLRTWLQNDLPLITLSGAGGSGKTRLAMEIVQEMASQWEGVFFVPLASLSDPELLYASIRDALSLSSTPDVSPLQQLERELAEKRTLLVLDNFEQLVDGGVQQLQLLREKLPKTTFLVTSRVLLNLPGEREFPLAPLPTPLQNTSLEAVRGYASVALFCDRSALALDADNVESISALCRRLDGIPLALELAAARAKILSPAQILERIGRHPNLLQSHEVGLPARHKTLRAAIAWSVELLSPELRRLFAQLSLFRGGWDMEAVERVCEEPDALDSLTQLRENSLILVENGAEQPRFRMLQTLREFGGEELRGEERQKTERAFFDYFLQLSQRAASDLQGPQQKESIRRLDAEQDNLRASLEWARQNDPAGGLALSAALLDYWETRLRVDEARHWLETFLNAAPEATDDPSLPTLSRALSGIGRLAWYSSDISSAQTFLEQGLEVARRTKDTATIIYAMRSLSRVISVLGHYQRACDLGQEGVQISREIGDTHLLREILIDSAFADMNVSRFETAALSCEEAIALARGTGDEHALSLSLLTLAIVLMYDERSHEALPLAAESIAISRSMGALWELVSGLSLQAYLWSKQRDFEGARRAYEEALRLVPAESFRSWNGFNMLWAVVIAFVQRGDREEAVYLLGAMESIRQSIGYTLLPFMVPEFEEVNSSLRHKLGDNLFDSLWNRGYGLTPQQTVEFVLNSSILD